MNRLDQGAINATAICLGITLLLMLLLGCSDDMSLHDKLNAKIDECNRNNKQVMLLAEDGGMPTAVICPADAVRVVPEQ